MSVMYICSYRSGRVKLSTLLPDRPCPLGATIFHAAAKVMIAGKGMRNEPLGALAVCDGHQVEVLEFVHILQGLTIKQDSLALLTRDEC